MFLMSGVIDETMTVWQAMFLPTELEAQVDRVKVQNSQGEYVPFVEDKILWYKAVGRPSVPEEAKSAVPASLALGGGIGAIAVVFALFLRKRRKGLEVFYGVYSALLGLGIGLPGGVLAFMSLFTDHAVTYWNENLFLANPLTLAAAPLGILLASGVRRAGQITSWLWVVHLGVSLLYLPLKLLPGFVQSNWQIVALLLPIYVGLAIAGRPFLMRHEDEM